MMKTRLLQILLTTAALFAVVASAKERAVELSFAADIAFKQFPTKGSVVDVIGLEADADGYVKVTFPAAKTSLIKPVTVRSRERVKAGESHQVIVTASAIRNRYAFYLDGKLQWENDNLNMPELKIGPTTLREENGAVVRNIKVLDVALDSERLAHSDVPGKTVYEVRMERNEAELRRRVAEEAGKALNPVVTGTVAAYTTDPMSEVPVLPDMIPDEADFNGEINVIAAIGEYESASLTVMALKPAGDVTLRISDLKCGGETIRAEDVDIRIVKRWYRTGGAWFSYFCDFRHRVLTPHLLVYDDDLVRVDEVTRRNYFRLTYPEGVRYADVSDPASEFNPITGFVPFEDAKNLQPVKSLDRFGRNVQYWLVFRGPEKPGLYKGKLDVMEGGAVAGTFDVNFRVLPFSLPLHAGSYDDPDRPYFSHLNFQCELAEGLSHEERRASALAILKSCFAHNTLDITGIWSHGDEYAELVREAGIPDDIIFGCPAPVAWQGKFFPKKNPAEISAEDRKIGMRMAERDIRAPLDKLLREHPDSEKWAITYSEAGAYSVLNVANQDQCRILHKYGINVFSHGGDNGWFLSGDFQDGIFGATKWREVADRWHAVGGRVGDYARPFASPENPAIHRRYVGLRRYKEQRFDGNMQHGLIDHHKGINEFAPDPTGDGNYRCQKMMYPTRAGVLETICWEGVREAFDDVKYLTVLKKLALKYRDSKDEPVRREARRALQWMEMIDGGDDAMSAVRLGAIERILTLMELTEGLK